MNKQKIMYWIGDCFRILVIMFTIIGIGATVLGGVIWVGKIYVEKQNVVDCLKAQDQALEAPDHFFASKEFWSMCDQIGISINTKDIR